MLTHGIVRRLRLFGLVALVAGVLIATPLSAEKLTLGNYVKGKGTTGLEDTYVKDKAGQLGNEDTLAVGLWNSKALIRFDVSALAGKDITSAKLHLFCQWMPPTETRKVIARAVLVPWVENEATIDEYAKGKPWQKRNIAGAKDRRVKPVDTCTVSGDPEKKTPHVWDLTSLVKEWVAGTLPNNGVVLEWKNGSGSPIVYRSSENKNYNRMRLDVEYEEPKGANVSYEFRRRKFLTDVPKAKHTIVIAKDTDVSTKAVADDFADILREITDTEFAIVTDDSEPGECEIVIGANNARLAKLGLADMTRDFAEGEYEIRTVGKKLVIAGVPNRGTINGMYGFLQDHLGCRWFTPGAMKMPKQSTLKIDNIRDRQKPSFVWRSTNYNMHWDSAWTARNRLNICLTVGGTPSIQMLMSDDRVKTIENYSDVHGLARIPKSLYDKHPEFYSMRNGKRVCPKNNHIRQYRVQYCVTNPEFVKWLAQWIMKDRLRGRSKTTNHIVEIGQADNQLLCQCPVCKTSYAKVGMSGTYVKFSNAVAEIVSKEYPNVTIRTQPYQKTALPPPMKVHPSVRPVWNHLVWCKTHGQDGCDVSRDRKVLSIPTGWAKKTSRFGVWLNIIHMDHLMPNLTMPGVANSLKAYKKLGIDYLFTETYPSSSRRDNVAFDGDKLLPAYGVAERNGYFTVPFGREHLRGYLTCRLLWDADYDWKAGLREFCDYYYGPAGKEMAEFLLTVEDVSSYEKTMDKSVMAYPGLHCISLAEKPKWSSIEQWNALCDTAFNRTKNDKTYFRRVEMARATVDIAIMVYTRKHTKLRQQAFKRFFPLMEELGQQRILRTAANMSPKTLAEFKELMSHPEKIVLPDDEKRVGANLLINSSFETDTDGDGVPDSWSGRGSRPPEDYRLDPRGIAIDTTRAHSGKNSVRLTKKPKKQSTVSLRQFLDVKPGERYRASVRYQADVKTGGVHIACIALDKNGKFLRHAGGIRGLKNTGDQWGQLSAKTPAIKDDTARLMIEFVFFDDQSEGVAWIDDFECARIET